VVVQLDGDSWIQHKEFSHLLSFPFVSAQPKDSLSIKTLDITMG